MDLQSVYPTVQIHKTNARPLELAIYGEFFPDKPCRICHSRGIPTFKLLKCTEDTKESKFNHYFCQNCVKYITDIFACCRSKNDDVKGDPKNGYICDSCLKIHNHIFALHIINTFKIKNTTFNFPLKKIELNGEIARKEGYFNDILWKCDICEEQFKRSLLIRPNSECDHSNSLYCQASKRCCDHYFCKECFNNAIIAKYENDINLDIEIVNCFAAIHDWDMGTINNCSSYFTRSTLERNCKETDKKFLLYRMKNNYVECYECKKSFRIKNRLDKNMKCLTPGCKGVICILCKKAHHKGACKTEDRIILLKNGNCKPCPHCYNGITKNTLYMLLFEIDKQILKWPYPIYFHNIPAMRTYIIYKKPNINHEYYKWYYVNEFKKEEELINKDGETLNEYILESLSKSIIGNWIACNYDRYIEDVTFTSDIFPPNQEILMLKPIENPKDAFEIKNSKGTICGYFKKYNIMLWCGESSNKSKYWIKKEEGEVLNDGKLYKNDEYLQVKANDLEVFQEICQSGKEKERIVFAKDMKVVGEALYYKLPGWRLQLQKNYDVYLKELNDKNAYVKCQKKAAFKKVDFGEGCEHISCLTCKQDCCIRCLARRSPILVHGNNYHRPSCPYYSYETIDKEKNIFNEKCHECVIFNKIKGKNGNDRMICPPPQILNENNDIPDIEVSAFEPDN